MSRAQALLDLGAAPRRAVAPPVATLATVRVTIGSQVRIAVADLPPRLLAQLQADHTRPNPAWAKAKQLGHWTGQIPRELYGWSVEEGWTGEELLLPRGQATLLVRQLRQQGLEVELLREAGLGEPLAATFTGQLRDHQEPAVRALVDGVQGLVVAPCGAGKTEIGCAAIARVGRSALILVHTLDLATQWQERIKLRLGLDAGLFGGGKKDVRPITVALIQTVARLRLPEVVALGQRFGTLIVDECHHVPARTMADTVNALACRWRWGLSATPEREDGLTFYLDWILGPVLHQIDQARLLACGHLVPAQIVIVKTGWTTELDASSQFTKVVEQLTEDPDRNRILVDLVAAELVAGGSVLVLSTRKAHCDEIARALTEQGFPVESLTSERGKKARKSALDRLRSGELRGCCATQLADEGLDVPRLTAVVLAAPGRSQRQTIQRLGRVMRPAPGKPTPQLYDLVDDVGLLQGQARARMRAYRQVLGTVVTRVVDKTGVGR